MPDNPGSPPKPPDRYSDLMSGSRRKPPVPFGAPALTQHVGLWIPDDFVSGHEPSLGRKDWIEAIERFIGDLYARLKDKGYKPSVLNWLAPGHPTPCLGLLDSPATGGGASPDVTRLQSFRVAFEWQSMPVMLSLEVRQEHLAITVTIDLSRWKPDDHAPLETDAANLNQALETLNRVTTERYAKVCNAEGEATKDSDRQALQTPYNVIYHAVWQSLDTSVFGTFFEGEESRYLGRLFFDLRGLVASQGEKDVIAMPGNGATGDSLEKRIGSKSFDDKEAIRRLDAFLPFLFSHRASLSKTDRLMEPVECGAEKFLGGRVLYASALGSQWPYPGPPHTPLTYMIYAANNYPRQLSRLEDRGHMLAAMRLAALYDRDLIMKADVQLRRLEREFAQLRGKMQGKEHEELLETDTEIIYLLPNFEQKLVEISQQMEDGHPMLIGGLTRRIVMSRFYQKQFRGLARGFRHRRIEGFPTYTEAVIRRLGGIYDHIDAVGELYQRVEQRLNVLSQQVETARSAGALNVIKGIQFVGELFVFLIAGPLALTDLILNVYDDEGWKPYIAAGSIAIGAIVALARNRDPLIEKILSAANASSAGMEASAFSPGL